MLIPGPVQSGEVELTIMRREMLTAAYAGHRRRQQMNILTCDEDLQSRQAFVRWFVRTGKILRWSSTIVAVQRSAVPIRAPSAAYQQWLHQRDWLQVRGDQLPTGRRPRPLLQEHPGTVLVATQADSTYNNWKTTKRSQMMINLNECRPCAEARGTDDGKRTA